MTPQTSSLVRRSSRVWSAAVLGLAAASMVPTLLAAQTPAPLQQGTAPAPSLSTASPSATWPANTKLFQTKIAKIAIPDGRPAGDFPLPQLRVYDKEGRRVLERLGFYAQTFPAFMTRALSGGTTANASRLLSHELDLVLTPDGKPFPVSALPAADYTLVDYWASWCLPCRAQDAELQKILAAKPDLRINLVKVEADMSQKTPQEINRMLQAGRDAAAARAAKPQG